MTTPHKISIASPDGIGDTSFIYLDGADIGQALTGLDVRLNVGHTNTAVLHLDYIATAIDGEFTCEIPATTRDVLVRLGWTPPAR